MKIDRINRVKKNSDAPKPPEFFPKGGLCYRMTIVEDTEKQILQVWAGMAHDEIQMHLSGPLQGELIADAIKILTNLKGKLDGTLNDQDYKQWGN